MIIKYFQGNIPNFGDELNPYIFNDILAPLQKVNNQFYGIGSVIDNRIPDEKCILFGCGVRDFLIEANTTWDIRFVRGPISAKALNLMPSKSITDSAYCLLNTHKFKKFYSASKKYELSLIPYFRHINIVNWRLLGQLTGIKIIFPNEPVENVIDQIASSQHIIAGAMHGAIVADILRVPWIRIKFPIQGYESTLTSELKWNDWIHSLNLDNKKFLHAHLWSNKQIVFLDLVRLFRSKKQIQSKTQLSTDNSLKRVREQLEIATNKLIKDYSQTCPQ